MVHHVVELPLSVIQIPWRSVSTIVSNDNHAKGVEGNVLYNSAGAHDDYTVVVNDSPQAMSNSHKRAVTARGFELIAKNLLDAAVRLIIHARRRLVEKHQLTLSDERATQREHLSLPVREVLPAGIHFRVQRQPLTAAVAACIFVCGEGRDAAAVLEGFGDSRGGYETRGIEVRFYGAVEEDGFLRDDGEALAETVAGDIGDVDAVIKNLALDNMCEAQKRENELWSLGTTMGRSSATYCALAGACPAHNGHALSCLETEIDVCENIRSVEVISNRHIAKLDITSTGPVLRDDVARIICVLAFLGIRLVVLFFRLQLDILLDSMKLNVLEDHS